MRNCLQCDKPLLIIKVNNNPQIYCNRACACAYRYRQKNIQVKAYKPKGKRLDIACKGCGDLFRPRPSDNRKFCSQKCYGQYRAITYRGTSHIGWKGDAVGYAGLHKWIGRKLGKPSLCEHCHTTEGRFEWANKSQEYKRDLDDWLRLCVKCHRNYDSDSYIKSWADRRAHA